MANIIFVEQSCFTKLKKRNIPDRSDMTYFHRLDSADLQSVAHKVEQVITLNKKLKL
jgi:hypothetical protein